MYPHKWCYRCPDCKELFSNFRNAFCKHLFETEHFRGREMFTAARASFGSGFTLKKYPIMRLRDLKKIVKEKKYEDFGINREFRPRRLDESGVSNKQTKPHDAKEDICIESARIEENDASIENDEKHANGIEKNSFPELVAPKESSFNQMKDVAKSLKEKVSEDVGIYDEFRPKIQSRSSKEDIDIQSLQIASIPNDKNSANGIEKDSFPQPAVRIESPINHMYPRKWHYRCPDCKMLFPNFSSDFCAHLFETGHFRGRQIFTAAPVQIGGLTVKTKPFMMVKDLRKLVQEKVCEDYGVNPSENIE